MNCDAPIDRKIKGEMIADLFSLIGIVSFDWRNTYRKIPSNKDLKYLSYMCKHAPIEPKKLKSTMKYRTNSQKRTEIGIIKEYKEEIMRSGNFEIAFPNKNWHLYKNYFENTREYNTLLFNYIGK